MKKGAVNCGRATARSSRRKLVKEIFPSEPNQINSSFPNRSTDFAGTLFFRAATAKATRTLKATATEAGTTQVADIYPDGNPLIDYGSDPLELTVANGRLFFTACEPEHGRELWVSDGTALGTRLVKDLSKFNNVGGNPNFFPMALTESGNKLFFLLNQGARGNQLWVTDGTATGTQLIKDITQFFPTGSR